jgi:hypothetical protein
MKFNGASYVAAHHVSGRGPHGTEPSTKKMIFSKGETTTAQRSNEACLPDLPPHMLATFHVLAMKMTKLLPLFAVIAMLCGCAVYTPSGSVVVDPHATVKSDSGFCPPGQAKKGRC